MENINSQQTAILTDVHILVNRLHAQHLSVKEDLLRIVSNKLDYNPHLTGREIWEGVAHILRESIQWGKENNDKPLEKEVN